MGAFYQPGRPFYAIAICNLFNPVTQLVPLLKLAGMNYANAFVVYMVVYFFIGCAGFYFLAREILKDRYMAYLAYVGLMFSSLGPRCLPSSHFWKLLCPRSGSFSFYCVLPVSRTRGIFWD